MKRLASLLVCLALLASLAACQKQEAGSDSVAPGSEISSQPLPAPEPTPGYLLPDVTSINPLTGTARPEGLATDARPVAVMVPNNALALPQRGVAYADVVYEMITEGGITRLMAVYPGTGFLPEVGPVRSTRDDFVQLVLPYNGVLVSIGTSVFARNLLSQLSYKIVNGIYLGNTAFYFDEERGRGKSNEFCWFTNGSLVQAGLAWMEMPDTGGVTALFAFGQSAAGEQVAESISLAYSAVAWCSFEYDAGSGLYLKSLFGSPHADEDGSRLAFTNVFALVGDMGVMQADGVTPDFDLSGGSGWYFTGGAAQPVTWHKQAPSGVLEVYAADGSQLTVQPGKSYIGFVPSNVEGNVLFGAVETPEEPIEQ